MTTLTTLHCIGCSACVCVCVCVSVLMVAAVALASINSIDAVKAEKYNLT